MVQFMITYQRTTGRRENGMKFCSRFKCGRVLSEGFESDTCPYCGGIDYSWSTPNIKELPPESFEVEMKCRKCGSTEELCYSEKRDYGSFSIGNEYECATCRDAWFAEMARQEAMNYILIDNDDDETHFFDGKDDLEKHFEDIVKNWDYESLEGYVENVVVLKVEKIEGQIDKKLFDRRSVVMYDHEWYLVEEVIEPQFESYGEMSISI